MPLKRRSATQDAPMKRFRVSRACDQCRSERSKCDGNQPQCAPCFESNKACTYTSNPRKRGLPPGYIRTIELALALVFQQNADIEASLITKLGQENTVLLARDTKESNRLHKNWRKTRFCRALNKTLTGEQPAIEDDQDRALSSGEDSETEAQDTNGTVASGAPNLESSTSLQPPASISPEVYQGLNMQQPFSTPRLTSLPVNYWKLLELYSTYTQCWFPICEKLDVLKLSYSYPSQGLVLSPEMVESGHHAEMWSILALGSCQVNSSSLVSREHHDITTPKILYDTARNLIPNEFGKFQLGHVKACLNLALFNLQSSSHNAAWILVGAAARILPSMNNTTYTSDGRVKHVVASCYLLDSLLSLLLNRRPYLDLFDLQQAGKLEEDGLEEWQPWDGELETGTAHQSRLPTLALSSFNNLLDVVDILVSTVRHSSANNHVQNNIARLKEWKATLSPKFDYIRSDSVTIPLTPPAVLLQLTHFATALALSPSQTWLHRFLEMMEACQNQLGSAKLPSVLICLLETVRRSSKSLPLNQATQAQISKMIADFSLSHAIRSSENVQIRQDGLTNLHTRDTFSHPGHVQIPLQSFPPRFSASSSTQHQQSPDPSSLLEELLPDMNSGQQGHVPQTFSPTAAETDFTSPALETYDPSVSGDLDSFFDELASLHGAKKLQNQSQFMENLGFAPEISMADLLATQSGQYLPLDPSTFGTENEGEPLQFPLSDYYDAG